MDQVKFCESKILEMITIWSASTDHIILVFLKISKTNLLWSTLEYFVSCYQTSTFPVHGLNTEIQRRIQNHIKHLRWSVLLK